VTLFLLLVVGYLVVGDVGVRHSLQAPHAEQTRPSGADGVATAAVAIADADAASPLVVRAERAEAALRSQARVIEELEAKLAQHTKSAQGAASPSLPPPDAFVASSTTDGAAAAARVGRPASDSEPESQANWARCQRMQQAGHNGASDADRSDAPLPLPTLHCHTDAHGHWLAHWSEQESAGLVSPSSGSGASSLRVSAPSWRWYRPMSLLLSAWERAQFDWHLLLPPRQPGDAGELALERLIAKEKALMNLLLQARSTSQFGPGHDPLFNPDLQFCPKLSDKCVLHRDEDECAADGLCVWSPAPMLLCVSRRRLQPDGVDAPAESASASLWPGHVLSLPNDAEGSDGSSARWTQNPIPMPDIEWPPTGLRTRAQPDSASTPPSASTDGAEPPSPPPLEVGAGAGPDVVDSDVSFSSSVASSPLQGFQSFEFVSLSAATGAGSAAEMATMHTYGWGGGAQPQPPSSVSGGWSVQHHASPMRRADCDAFVKGDSFVLDMGNNAGMFWHFLTEQVAGLVPHVLTPSMRSAPSNVHFFFRKHNPRGEFDTLWQWFHVHTLNCGQSVHELVAHGRVCFERLHTQQAPSFASGGGLQEVHKWVTHAVQRTGLDKAWIKTTHEQDKEAGVASSSPAAASVSVSAPALTVGFVSRQDKRILLNENALVSALSSPSSVSVPASHSLRIAYETLPIHLQLAATRQIDVLTGLHGSGLLNTVFMRGGHTTGELQIVPVGLWTDPSFVSCYVSTAAAAQVHYGQLDVRDESRGVKHWHFAGKEGVTLDYKNRLAEQGARAVTSGMARILFIQQDTIVDPEQFLNKVKQIKDAIDKTTNRK
jgi:hypothetical protein